MSRLCGMLDTSILGGDGVGEGQAVEVLKVKVGRRGGSICVCWVLLSL